MQSQEAQRREVGSSERGADWCGLCLCLEINIQNGNVQVPGPVTLTRTTASPSLKGLAPGIFLGGSGSPRYVQ